MVTHYSQRHSHIMCCLGYIVQGQSWPKINNNKLCVEQNGYQEYILRWECITLPKCHLPGIRVTIIYGLFHITVVIKPLQGTLPLVHAGIMWAIADVCGQLQMFVVCTLSHNILIALCTLKKALALS